MDCKGHVGVPQNELCDAKAKSEVERCAEGIVEEVVKDFGEIKNREMRVESRHELAKKRTWMASYHLGMMAVCRSRLAKKFERWAGNSSIFQADPGQECMWCETPHETNFCDSIRKCPKVRGFRDDVKERWKKITAGEEFDPELLFGKVKKALFKRVCQKAKDEKQVWGDFCAALRWWERRIQKLRNDIREDLEAKEAEEEEKEEDGDDDDDDETEEKEKQLACSIRVMDVGSVKRGEPDILSPPSGKQELKRFLLSDRRRSAHSAV